LIFELGWYVVVNIKLLCEGWLIIDIHTWVNPSININYLTKLPTNTMTSPTYPNAMLPTINNDQIWDFHILRDSALLSDPTLQSDPALFTDPALLSFSAPLTETALFTDSTLLSYLSLLTDPYPVLLLYPTPLDTRSFQQLIGRLI